MISVWLFFILLTGAPRELAGWQEIVAQYERGEREQALEAMKEWVRAKPKSPQKWLYAAQFLAEHNDFVNCEFFAARAFQKLPGVAATHIILGTVYLYTSRTVESEDLFRAAAEKFSELPILRYHLGLACGFNKKTIEAQTHFEAAIKARPDNRNFLFAAGENCFLLGRFVEAAKYFQKSGEVDPPHPEGSVRLAMTLTSLNRFEAAETYFQKALHSPVLESQLTARLEYGKFLLERRRFEEAIEHLDVVVQQRPGQRMGWNYHARCLNALGRREAARESLRRFRELQQQQMAEVNEAIRSGFTDPPPVDRDP